MDKELNKFEKLKNLDYQAHYGTGSREQHQACEDSSFLGAISPSLPPSRQVGMEIPTELQSLVSCSGLPSVCHSPQVRREHLSMFTDEVIRKYAPWSTPSSERVAVAAKDARLFQKQLFRPKGFEATPQAGEVNSDMVYIEHQHDLAHRFDHGSVQLYDTRRKTVGPMSPFWMLRMPRRGQWRYAIGRVIGRTLAGEVSFTVEDVWSDSTVGDLLDMVSMNDDDVNFSVISQGTHPEALPLSELLLNSYPEPEIAPDGVSELAVTVVAQEREKHVASPGDMPSYLRERPAISLFFGLISFRK